MTDYATDASYAPVTIIDGDGDEQTVYRPIMPTPPLGLIAEAWALAAENGDNASLISSTAQAQEYIDAHPSGPTSPVNVVAPVIYVNDPPHLVEVGATATVSDGEWTGTEPITFEYQWGHLFGFPGEGFEAETNSSYVIRESDLDAYLKATVTATNEAGSYVGNASAGPITAP
jgi:hypothetical protein